MATGNPMGGDGIVALDLTDGQRQFLLGTLVSCRIGREDDLRTHPDHPNANRWRANAAAYGRLIGGIVTGWIAPDAEVRRHVLELAEANDREEEYERIVFEHNALTALCEQVGAGR
jgi:hypothetical protein